MAECPDRIVELVERFDRNIEAYRAPAYKEDRLRIEFLDPFFEALGWDVRNERGYAENYKDVVIEDSIRIGGESRAPDYCFRIGGTRKFFVEAKKPAINIGTDDDPAFQLRRYAWSAKLPLSILTDFEELAVYDTRIRPQAKDRPSIARVRLFRYADFPDVWPEIAAIFSREEVLRGSFDRYAEKGRKRGTSEVDAEFLKEIERWRMELARNIALRNRRLTTDELNFAVQRTIDRIIFLRMCEDRGTEALYSLADAAKRGDVYSELRRLYVLADQKYNSGLFHFETEPGREAPDLLTPSLNIDDRVLADIIGSLYYPESPYEFSMLPADILGNVYEQFLGKVIRLTRGHQAKVEDKPEVKKAGGVYYTPKYIVDYIVAHTVGELCKGRTPAQVAKLRILDPACGSGSFLIGAYTYLLDWHLWWYIENNKGLRGKVKKVYKDRKGNLRLTIAEKKRILLNNVYGVDIDSQAVEVTKLSLLLKVLEGENNATMEQQLELIYGERALPDLCDNIKCGNSLIAPDYFDGILIPNEEEIRRVNPFDWRKEFPEIFDRPAAKAGFDAVIGNPPYVRQETLGSAFKDYAKKTFRTFAGTADLYIYFYERSHELLKRGGLFGMISSNKFMRANYGKALRDFLAEETRMIQIVDFGELPVFQNAATFPVIFLTSNNHKKSQSFIYAPIKRLDFLSLVDEVGAIGETLDGRSLSGDNWTLAGADEIAIFDRMKRVGTPLGDYVKGKVYRGVLTGLNKAFVIDRATRDQLIAKDPKSAEVIKPFVVGDDVRKYRINFRERYLILFPKGWTRQNMGKQRGGWKWLETKYPAIARHLAPFADAAEKRHDKGEYWWELRACDYYAEFEKPKIMYPDISKSSRLTLDTEGMFAGNTVYIIPKGDKYLLGLLNSSLIFAFYKRVASVLGDADKGGRMRWFSQDVLKLPIRVIDFADAADKARHDKMVALVERMLKMNKKLQEVAGERQRAVLQNRIEATDAEIDALVYELYGLTKKEIAIVEGRSA